MIYLKEKQKIFIVLSLYFCLVTLPHQHDPPSMKTGTVIDIKNNYVVARVHHSKIMLKTKEILNYNDVIDFDGTYELIHVPFSKYSFNVQDYLNNNNIHYSISPKIITVNKKGRQLRSLLFERIQHHTQKELLLKLIFNINNNEMDLTTLMYSSGYTIRTLIIMILSLLSLYVTEDSVSIVEAVLLIVYLFIFKDVMIFLRLLIPKLLKNSSLSRLNVTTITFLILLIINPRQVYHYGFIITFTVRFFKSFYTDAKGLWIPLLIIPLQLYFNNRINFIEILFFRLRAKFNALLFISALCDVLLMTSISNVLVNILLTLRLPEITVTGHLYGPLLMIWWITLLQSAHHYKKIHIIPFIVILWLTQNQSLFMPHLSLTQLYVNQGDSAVFRFPHSNEVLFLDVGPASSFSKVQGYLDYYGIKKFRAIISHHDDDHDGNLKALQEKYNCLQVIDDRQDILIKGLMFKQLNHGNYDNDNDNSLTHLFKINDITFLYTGDISENVEKKILDDYDNLSFNVLKLAHHGSKHSSSQELLSHQYLQLIINSSGVNNLYHHPAREVLERLDRVGLPLIDIQSVGDISFIFFNNISLIKQFIR